MRTYKTSNIQYIVGFKKFKQFSLLFAQDLKCYNKKAVEVVPLVKDLKEKENRKKNGKRRREENSMSIIYRKNF